MLSKQYTHLRANKMSNNPRDTQFQGFAKALMSELLTYFCDFEDMKKTIARRAYDLVEHTIVELSCQDALDFSSPDFDKYEYTASEMVEIISDMTELQKDIDEKEVERRKEIDEILSHADELDMWELHEKLCNVGLPKEQE